MRRIQTTLLCLALAGMGTLLSGQEVRVTTPDSLDYWDIGKTYTIEWQTPGITAAEVKIRLFDKTASNLLLKITDNTPNDGRFDWEVPGSLDEGEYTIRVTVRDQPYGAFSRVFHIQDRREIHIRLLTPTGGERFAAPGSIPIRWEIEHGHLVEGVRLILKRGGTVRSSTTSSNTGSVTAPLTEDVCDGDDYTIRIEDEDDPSVFAESGAIEIFHSTPPSIELTRDVARECVQGQTHRITWIGRGFDGVVAVELLRNGSLERVMAGAVRDAFYNWSVHDPAGAGYRIRISARNTPGVSDTGDLFAILRPADLLVFSRGIFDKTVFLKGESARLNFTVNNPVHEGIPVTFNIRFVKGRVSPSAGVSAKKLYMLAQTKYEGTLTGNLNAGIQTEYSLPVTIRDDRAGEYTVVITVLPSASSGFRDNRPGNNTIYGYFRVGLKLLRPVR